MISFFINSSVDIIESPYIMLISFLIRNIIIQIKGKIMAYKKLFLALLGASSAHAEASRSVFREMDLTEGQPKILYILNRKDGYVQKELAEQCGIKASTLSVILTALKMKDLIRKESCIISGQKKANRIFLTDNGILEANKLEQQIEKLEKKGFFGFSEEEKIQLLTLLEKVELNMKRTRGKE